jgi:hypothetical protein
MMFGATRRLRPAPIAKEQRVDRIVDRHVAVAKMGPRREQCLDDLFIRFRLAAVCG